MTGTTVPHSDPESGITMPHAAFGSAAHAAAEKYASEAEARLGCPHCGDWWADHAGVEEPICRARLCVRCQERPVEVAVMSDAPHAHYCEPCGNAVFGAWRHFVD